MPLEEYVSIPPSALSQREGISPATGRICGLLARFCYLFAFMLVVAGHAWGQPLPDRMDLVGRVVDKDGVAVKNAALTMRRPEYGATATFWGARAVCDDDGGFRIRDAEAGAYILAVSAPGFANWQQKIVFDADGTPLTIKLHRQVDLMLQITGVDGQPLRGSDVRVVARGPFYSMDRDEYRGFALRTDDKGMVSTGPLFCASYSYAVLVLGNGGGYAAINAVEAVELGPTKANVRLQPGGGIELAVTDEDGRKLGGAVPQLKRLPGAGESADMTMYEQYWSKLQTREADGVLAVRDLMPGRYALDINLPGYSGETAKVDVAPGATASLAVKLHRTTDVTPLEITVVDRAGKAVANTEFCFYMYSPAAVADKKLRMPAGLIRMVRTDANGKTTVYPVWPATWHVLLLKNDASQLFVQPWENNVVARDRKTVTATDNTISFTIDPPGP